MLAMKGRPRFFAEGRLLTFTLMSQGRDIACAVTRDALERHFLFRRESDDATCLGFRTRTQANTGGGRQKSRARRGARILVGRDLRYGIRWLLAISAAPVSLGDFHTLMMLCFARCSQRAVRYGVNLIADGGTRCRHRCGLLNTKSTIRSRRVGFGRQLLQTFEKPISSASCATTGDAGLRGVAQGARCGQSLIGPSCFNMSCVPPKNSRLCSCATLIPER